MASSRMSSIEKPGEILPGSAIGGPTPWVVAVMTCLATMGLAAALALNPAASALSDQIAGRATVQIVEPDPLARREAVRAVRDHLRDQSFVMSLHTVPEAELKAMAARWLGESEGFAGDAGLPLPALIDVDLVGGNQQIAMQRLRAAVSQVAPQARVIAHADWLGPVADLMRSLGWLAAAMAALLVAAASAVAVLAARAALSAQQTTIDILHLVGATDVQIARLFQRQTARDALIGAGVGGSIAILVIGFVIVRGAAISSGLATGAADGPWRYALAGLVPPLVVCVAVVTARLAVISALRRKP